MQTYSDFLPSAFDCNIPIDGRKDWQVLPCMRNRDSDVLGESNFHTALKLLGGCDTVEVHRFGHWACGWYEIIIVAPGSAAHKIAEKIECKLSDYIVLNEDDLSDREHTAACETWAHCFNVRERIAYIRAHRSQFEFRDLCDVAGCVRGSYFLGSASELLG